MKQFQKITIIGIVFILSIQSIYAQDVTMAKAFFAKAQQAYVDKDYENTIELLEKTKEKLGKTNPEIVYLEAKSRYEHDLNINKTKELMQTFLKTADKSDERVKEIAGLLADIEVSDNYFSNGLKKTHSGKDSIGNAFEVDYYINGSKSREKKVDTDGGIYENFYNEIGEKLMMKSFNIADKKLVYTIYYVNNIRRLAIFSNDNKTIMLFNSKGQQIQEYEYEKIFSVDQKDYLNNKITFYKNYVNNSDYTEFPIAPYNTKKDWWFRYEILKIYQLNTLPHEIHKEYSIIIGLISELKVSQYHNYIIFKFDQEGIPLSKKLFNKNGKLQNTYYYDLSTNGWIEQ